MAKIISEETRRKLSDAMKKKIAEGYVPFKLAGLRLGCKHTDEAKRKMSIDRKGFSNNTGRTHFKKGVATRLGKGHSEETKKKLSEAMKKRIDAGWKPPLTGKKHSDESIKKIKEARKNQDTSGYLVGVPWTEDHHKSLWRKNKETVGAPHDYRAKQGYDELWAYIRRHIYKRDKYECQVCGVKNVVLNCHHIDYKKENNNFDNLITLCQSCHMKTNFDRYDWMAFFKDKSANNCSRKV